METLRDLDILRAAPSSVRAAPVDDGSMPTMEVRFSPFGEWYEISSWWEGDFMERTSKGAFAKTMREQRDQVKCLFDHGYDAMIGNKVLGVIDEMREDPDSAVGVVPLFDTTYNRDLVPGLEAGVYGSSFRFRVIRDEWNDEPGVSDYNPKGLPERTIKEVRLYEFGPVTFPANPSATAALRCLTDSYYERLRSRNPERVDALAARARSLRTPDVTAAPAGTVTDGAAPTPTDAPASSHPNGLSAARRARELDLPFLRS